MIRMVRQCTVSLFSRHVSRCSFRSTCSCWRTGPWVLTSTGVGSIYSCIFSSRHPQKVTGLLLIDPPHEDLHCLGARHRALILWAWGVISPLGLDRLSGALFRGCTREDRVYGRSASQGGKYLKAKLQESLVADTLTKNEISTARAIQRKRHL